MKKFFSFMIALVAMFAMSMSAQTLEQPKFFDNTYFRLEGGATALTHPGCNGYEDWGHTIQGVIGTEAGKWITPKFGVAFEGDFGIRNGSKNGAFNYQLIVPEDNAAGAYLKKAQRFNYINVTGLVKFNLSNIFTGWKPNRKWEFVVATGPMWIHGFPGKNYENDFGVKFKAEVNYNVTNRWQLNLIPEFNYNLTGGYSLGTRENPRFDSRNSWYALKVGVTYKIGNQFTECPYKYTQAEMDALNAQINDLRSRQPEVVTQVVEKVVTKEVAQQNVYVVAFDYGKSNLDSSAMDVLNTVPQNCIVDVIGEASYPGTPRANQKLSDARAKVVANYLANRGVRVNSATGVGATGHQIVKIVVK